MSLKFDVLPSQQDGGGTHQAGRPGVKDQVVVMFVFPGLSMCSSSWASTTKIQEDHFLAEMDRHRAKKIISDGTASTSLKLLVLLATSSLATISIPYEAHNARKLIKRDGNPQCRAATLTIVGTSTFYTTVNTTSTASTVSTSIQQTTDVSQPTGTPTSTVITSPSGGISTITTSRTTSSAITTTVSTSTTSTTPSSTSKVQFDGCQYHVAGTGSFVNRASWSFTGSSLPDGLTASNGPVNDSTAPINHYFTPDNAIVADGFLNLLVPGGQNPAASSSNSISAAEVSTIETQILYASVRTNAIFSSVPGTCHGIFFYHSDNAEIDIEYLTDPNSQANNRPRNPIPIWYTNQPLTPGTDPTSSTGPGAVDDTLSVHEYRIDWVSGMTKFYIDSVLQKTFTTNVPSTGGPWVFNNWANGDPAWSAGPPAQDNIFRIKDIVMYYNTTTSGACSA